MTSEPEIVEINSWADLTKMAEEWLTEGDPKIYRGVSSAKYELVPKIGRPETRRGRPYDPVVERDILARFRLEAQPYVEIQPSQAEWLFIAQHHGLPTRLLDWSFSPLIAAYFAVERGGADGDATIFAAPLPDQMAHVIGGDPLACSEVVPLLPSHVSRRISAQRAVFTIHPRPDDPYKPDGLVKAVIERSACLNLKHLLHECGFSRATLFPGLDGICQDLAWAIKWQEWPAERVPEASSTDAGNN